MKANTRSSKTLVRGCCLLALTFQSLPALNIPQTFQNRKYLFIAKKLERVFTINQNWIDLNQNGSRESYEILRDGNQIQGIDDFDILGTLKANQHLIPRQGRDAMIGELKKVSGRARPLARKVLLDFGVKLPDTEPLTVEETLALAIREIRRLKQSQRHLETEVKTLSKERSTWVMSKAMMEAEVDKAQVSNQVVTKKLVKTKNEARETVNALKKKASKMVLELAEEEAKKIRQAAETQANLMEVEASDKSRRKRKKVEEEAEAIRAVAEEKASAILEEAQRQSEIIAREIGDKDEDLPKF